MFNFPVLVSSVGRVDWNAFEYWPRGHKTLFILISAEPKLILLINVQMPTIVGI